MRMLEPLRAAVRRRPPLGAVISIAVHAVLLLVLFWVPPGHKPVQKRGDALIVELPDLQEPAIHGTPGPSADAPIPAAPEPKARPAPPAPPARPTPPPRTPTPARPTPKAEPRQAPRQVASAPQPAPSAERGDAPTMKSATEPSKPEPTLPPDVASTPPPPGSVARVPPPAPDIRSAFRRGGGGGGTGTGGAGGTGLGRGGIEGSPISLNSTDPDFNDYLERVRALIERNWTYPCVDGGNNSWCERRSAQLVIEFGILKNGQLAFVELHKSSGYLVMDDSASNAIKLASPFPAVPAVMLKGRGGTGIPIVANFHYILQTDLKHIIR